MLYEIMTNKEDDGRYYPNYENLIAKAPSEDIKNVLKESQKITEKFGGFAYNAIYVMKMKCGHYELFQHQVVDEDDLINWIHLMHEERNYSRCTMCICDI